MGNNNIPRHPCTGCPDRASYAISAQAIEDREQSIAKRKGEKKLIKEEDLFSRVRKLGRVWAINFDNSRDRDMIKVIEEYADGMRMDELNACPGLYCRDVVIFSDSEGPDVKTPESLCGTRAHLEHIDTSPESGWHLANPQT